MVAGRSQRICKVPIISSSGPFNERKGERNFSFSVILGLCYLRLNLIPTNIFGNIKLLLSPKFLLCLFRKDKNFAVGR